MKSFFKWGIRHWKCITGIVVSMAGIYLATTGEYQTGMHDVSELYEAVGAEAKRLGRELTDTEAENICNKWIEKTYK